MNYPGSKNGEGVWQTIINQIPPHRVYVELFAGSAAILRRKRPAQFNAAVEIDGQTVDALRIHLPASVSVYHEDGLHWLQQHPAGADWFIYVDPPYLFETRRGGEGRIYRYEYGSLIQHNALLMELRRSKAMVTVSGYRHPVYDDLLHDWRRLDYTAQTRQGPATESLWMNYAVPATLHDYAHLGRDRTDRQRIRRKIARLQSKLAALHPLERAALLSSVT